MMTHSLKQSSRIIINKPNLTDAYMKRIIRQRINEGQTIDEVWIMEDSYVRFYIKSQRNDCSFLLLQRIGGH